MADAKFGLQLSSSGVFKEFETCQQKKNRRKLESPAGNVRPQNKNWLKNMPDSAFPRTLYDPRFEDLSSSTLDEQRICVNMQLKSSKKQLK